MGQYLFKIEGVNMSVIYYIYIHYNLLCLDSQNMFYNVFLVSNPFPVRSIKHPPINHGLVEDLDIVETN